ncbi:DUF1707 domain-containing protein [Saccharopolyspora sp. NFXS83]|uniref:DUF1707 SHOCT-like domain-containing protein n=1 Tax=Saccharopolyspora sp. NFXS83 TaxID=2993560 RepID=UPI00224B41D1|nr:DUF1707 domain-containing protein [Saccharopolyspora sp. NFXS83]MCX2730562.1 DUF1707 domain-containing protein [Saccharopolyspora sp. NFXS83]
MSELMHADVEAVTWTLEHGGTRPSDSDRAQGQRLLDEHVAMGRLTSEEFGDRAAQVQHARTKSELLAAFQGLPRSHPRFDEQVQPRRFAIPEPTADVPHLRYAVTAIVSSCAVAGAIGTLLLALQEPAVLFAAAGVLLTVYFALVILGHRTES